MEVREYYVGQEVEWTWADFTPWWTVTVLGKQVLDDGQIVYDVGRLGERRRVTGLEARDLRPAGPPHF